MSEVDRMDRAGRYVLGLMDDDERERAERDLEIDPAFRDAMVEIAERMHVFDRTPRARQGAAGRLAADQGTHRRHAADAAGAGARTDAARAAGDFRQAAGPTRGATRSFRRRRPRPSATGLHSVPDRRAFVLAFCLIAAFALGYMACEDRRVQSIRPPSARTSRRASDTRLVTDEKSRRARPGGSVRYLMTDQYGQALSDM